MCFDVPKLVRSPGYDQGHDEEYRNGRDIKIDILDDYIRTPDEFRGSPDIYRSVGGLSEPSGDIMGQHGPCGRERRGPRAGRAPSPWESELDKERGGAPSFLPLFLSFLPPSSFLVGLGKGSPTPTRRRTPPSLLGAPQGRPASPLLLYIRGQGAS